MSDNNQDDGDLSDDKESDTDEVSGSRIGSYIKRHPTIPANYRFHEHSRLSVDSNDPLFTA